MKKKGLEHIHNNTQNGLRSWQILILPGVLYILAGFLAFAVPFESYLALYIISGIFIFISGISEIVFFVRNRTNAMNREGCLLAGILDLVIAFLLLAYPEAILSFLPFYMGIWLLFRGIVAVGFSYRARLFGKLDWIWLLLLASGIVNFFFLLLHNSINDGLNTSYVTGMTFVVAGAFRLFLAFDLKMMHSFKNEYEQIVLNTK
ncbi:HdeD family acid-resistance protein [Maribacter sp. ACAM166]|uniref:HdeD family acid-resistance protein n=1 Tax=Maribacter sp. ACAM166 TaxID=2508996 RepID=UPI0010FE592D|nr:DUF308 domain-containing protein [Maribacter sp. ACAM166]TLP81745.1 HdeD family acid-resistance protein [Maribacter sp. ACAM166]